RSGDKALQDEEANVNNTNITKPVTG
ncbi:MAG: hypothetical protein ACI956_000567, partial [Nonlabens sp.]